MRPMARLYAKKTASRSAAVKVPQRGLYFLAESANLLLQKREKGLKIQILNQSARKRAGEVSAAPRTGQWKITYKGKE